MVTYSITDKGVFPANLHINDSHNVSKWSFEDELDAIKKDNPDSEIWRRRIFGMEMEWTCHNFAYLIHYKVEQTKDVDLDYPQSATDRLKYLFCGILLWIFIK